MSAMKILALQNDYDNKQLTEPTERLRLARK